MSVSTKEILAEYESGIAYHQIAKNLGISESTVRKYLTECKIANTLEPSNIVRRENMNLIRQKKPQFLSDERVLELYRNHTLLQIARICRVPKDDLEKQLERIGVNLNPDFYESVTLAVCQEKSYLYIKGKVLPYGPELIRNVNYLMENVLTEVERYVFKALYRDKKLFRVVAKELGRSDSGVGDIRDRALKKLRKPENFMYFTMDFEEVQKELEKERAKKLIEENDRESLQYIKQYVSIRTFHIIQRAGYHNIDDLKNDPERLVYFRGAGRCAIAEVMNVLKILQQQEVGGNS